MIEVPSMGFRLFTRINKKGRSQSYTETLQRQMLKNYERKQKECNKPAKTPTSGTK